MTISRKKKMNNKENFSAKRSIIIDLSWTIQLSLIEQKKLKKWISHAEEVLWQVLNDKILFKYGELPIENLKLSLLVCGDMKIRNLNREYRSKNKITDVLSFPQFENLRGLKNRSQLLNMLSHFQIAEIEEIFLGDIAICFPQAKRQALQNKIGVWDEFIHLFFHGALHLMGYDHEISIKEARVMESLEDYALTSFSCIKGK